MTPPVIYSLFGGGFSGTITLVLLRPANALTCEGGLSEHSDILGNPDECVNMFGSAMLGLVGAVNPFIAAGGVGVVVLNAGLALERRRSG